MSMQGIDENLVLEFLYAFSRFEYALKRSGYHGQDGKAAEADWDRFENALTDLPPADIAPVLALGDYTLARPPKKQVVKGGGLNWEDSAPTASDIKTLIIYVRGFGITCFRAESSPKAPCTTWLAILTCFAAEYQY